MVKLHRRCRDRTPGTRRRGADPAAPHRNLVNHRTDLDAHHAELAAKHEVRRSKQNDGKGRGDLGRKKGGGSESWPRRHPPRRSPGFRGCSSGGGGGREQR
uniref:Uncharacterized protein n=1 Tax=Setaria italica TaxID=4555 RepID=K4A4I0_SETIT